MSGGLGSMRVGCPGGVGKGGGTVSSTGSNTSPNVPGLEAVRVGTLGEYSVSRRRQPCPGRG